MAAASFGRWEYKQLNYLSSASCYGIIPVARARSSPSCANTLPMHWPILQSDSAVTGAAFSNCFIPPSGEVPCPSMVSEHPIDELVFTECCPIGHGEVLESSHFVVWIFPAMMLDTSCESTTGTDSSLVMSSTPFSKRLCFSPAHHSELLNFSMR